MTINIDKKTLLNCFTDTAVFPPLSGFNHSHKFAAVLVPIIDDSIELKVLFTLRTPHLKHHAGQISFPGGMMEATDQTLIHTALRETQEEIGLAASNIQILGTLKPLLSNTQFLVTPVVGLINTELNLTIDTYEVAEIFTVPLNFVLDTNNQQKQIYKQSGQTDEIYVIEYGQHRIWGLTAKILVDMTYQLLKKR